MPDSALVWLVAGALLSVPYLAVGLRLGASGARAWWVSGVVVAAAVYVGFAFARSAPLPATLFETGGVAVYGLLAARSLRGDLRFVAAAWLLHAIWDVGLHRPGGFALAPSWYVWTCLSFDLVVGLVLWRRATRPGPSSPPLSS